MDSLDSSEFMLKTVKSQPVYMQRPTRTVPRTSDDQHLSMSSSSEVTDPEMSPRSRLITQVMQHPYLYDASHVDRNDRDLIEQTWAAISREMNQPVAKCKMTWKNLRDSFSRELRKKIRGSSYGKKITWPHFDELTFLIGSLGSRYATNTGSHASSADTQATPITREKSRRRKAAKSIVKAAQAKAANLATKAPNNSADANSATSSTANSAVNSESSTLFRFLEAEYTSKPPEVQAEIKRRLLAVFSDYF